MSSDPRPLKRSRLRWRQLICQEETEYGPARGMGQKEVWGDRGNRDDSFSALTFAVGRPVHTLLLANTAQPRGGWGPSDGTLRGLGLRRLKLHQQFM